MQVSFTNTTGAAIYVHPLLMSLGAGATVTTRRSQADLDRDQIFKQHVVAGSITLAFTLESGDAARIGGSAPLLSYSNATRPAANTVRPFTPVWNTDDNALNWSDGTNWRDAAGVIT